MKFAIIILIVLGVVSLLSMLMDEYPDFFGKSSILYTMLQQHSPYSSWWYMALIWLLVLSLFLCVIQNVKPVFKSMYKPNLKPADEIEKMKLNLSVKKKSDDSSVKIIELLKKQFYSIDTQYDDVSTQISATKLRWSNLGHLITHIGLLVIVIGGMIYSTTAKKEFQYMIAKEHKSDFTEFIEKYPSFSAWNIPTAENEFITVVVDSFRLGYYKGGIGTDISDFRSFIQVFDHNGDKIRNHEVTVNSPFLYKNLSIHQSDYKPLEYIQNNPNWKQIQEMRKNMKDRKNWITGFSLKKNSGKSIIYLGMLFGVVGMMMSFFFWRKDIFIAITKHKIHIGGRTTKNKISFERELITLSERIRSL
ncbi:MAG: cytochrome c biogenesis protein ResB [Candidatus Marinimicrobia bacterium]|nr:cytochrome c biogenesis protein ResB [Candidatus Neomarinimicrobiota bacterium]MBL7022563.1 cytochrome c biogenesis protein ResB [Candidatus Neomarinimicrobiota bacterium]MBL7108919.1 cytochrome c biogenesis protein ResB [Candidatus Neomarinimicrobiota bacterium]